MLENRMLNHWANLDLRPKNLFSEFQPVIEEYFQKGHAELVADADILKLPHSCVYMPMHAVQKESSSMPTCVSQEISVMSQSLKLFFI